MRARRIDLARPVEAPVALWQINRARVRLSAILEMQQFSMSRGFVFGEIQSSLFKSLFKRQIMLTNAHKNSTIYL